ncbi:MAG: CDP-alcohol phosphatidyltransferase family protein [Opitutus sp.]
MRSPPYLPNLLSSLRIALAPAILGAAHSNSRLGFFVLVVVAMATDEVDGVLARWWNAESEMGRRLDHWGDALTALLGGIGVYILWPEIIEPEWTWALAALGAYLAIGIDRLWRRPDSQPAPRWWERIMALLPPLSLIPLITGWSPWPFRVAAVLQVLLSLRQLCLRRAAAESEGRRMAEPSSRKAA